MQHDSQEIKHRTLERQRKMKTDDEENKNDRKDQQQLINMNKKKYTHT